MNALAVAHDRDDRPREDHFVILRGVTWTDYQRLLEVRGDRSAPRITYLEGTIQIMSPSREHESIKGLIGCLVEVFCLERGVEFSTYGSWTIEDEKSDRGAEPDESYVFRDDIAPERPDLAIEVIWTSGGLNKLNVYAKLGVHEVWYWRKGTIIAYALEDGAYVERAKSDVLPGIDLVELVRYLDRPSTSAAMRDYRDALRQRG